jgi:hypothetical protein
MVEEFVVVFVTHGDQQWSDVSAMLGTIQNTQINISTHKYRQDVLNSPSNIMRGFRNINISVLIYIQHTPIGSSGSDFIGTIP